jgi:hypothetical protein
MYTFMEKLAWCTYGRKFANILRMNKNSLFLLLGQSKESNTRTLPNFGVVKKQSSDFCKNINYGSEHVYIII